MLEASDRTERGIGVLSCARRPRSSRPHAPSAIAMLLVMASLPSCHEQSSAAVDASCTDQACPPLSTTGGTSPSGGASAIGGRSGPSGSTAGTAGAESTRVGGAAGSAGAHGPQGEWEKFVLTREFVGEGATFGDFDGDGELDLAAGSHWYSGPTYRERHEFRPPALFDPYGYSDSFFLFDLDVDQDGWVDLLVVGFPGQSAVWVENPGPPQGHWASHLVTEVVDGESPTLWARGDGDVALVHCQGGEFGVTPIDPAGPQPFQPISQNADCQTFTHGLGLGDVNGDGALDLLHAQGAWLQPAEATSWTPWEVDFGPGGAQMFATDLDGDGDQDVVTSLEAHGYGLAWFEQPANAGTPVRHLISGGPDTAAETNVVLHEPHAVALIDVDGDGQKDIVSGERFWGHVPADPDPNAEAQLAWFRRRAGPGPQFEAEIIDADSGVGTQLVARWLETESAVGLAIANKKGVFVFKRSGPRR